MQIYTLRLRGGGAQYCHSLEHPVRRTPGRKWYAGTSGFLFVAIVDHQNLHLPLSVPVWRCGETGVNYEAMEFGAPEGPRQASANFSYY
jgi:hypothetical protein